MSEYSIGLDLGGTNLRAAAVDRDGKMLQKIWGTTDLTRGPEAVVEDMSKSIDALRHALGSQNLQGIGVAVPGFIRLKEGVIAGSNNLAVLEGFPMRDALQDRLGTQVILENDANAAAMGEKWIGAGRHVDDLVLLTLGTGIGGGIISEGRILHGFLGMAGEVGHVTVVPNGNPCGCGNHGCLEKHASATAIACLARMIGLGEITSEEVYSLAKAGDERALAVFDHMGRALGIALAMLVNVFNFPLYLISGGPLPAWDIFSVPMMAELKERSFTYRASKTVVARAELGNEAGLYGAAYLPWETGLAHVAGH
jgi:glucokinase